MLLWNATTFHFCMHELRPKGERIKMCVWVSLVRVALPNMRSSTTPFIMLHSTWKLESQSVPEIWEREIGWAGRPHTHWVEYNKCYGLEKALQEEGNIWKIFFLGHSTWEETMSGETLIGFPLPPRPLASHTPGIFLNRKFAVGGRGHNSQEVGMMSKGPEKGVQSWGKEK